MALTGSLGGMAIRSRPLLSASNIPQAVQANTTQDENSSKTTEERSTTDEKKATGQGDDNKPSESEKKDSEKKVETKTNAQNVVDAPPSTKSSRIPYLTPMAEGSMWAARASENAFMYAAKPTSQAVMTYVAKV